MKVIVTTALRPSAKIMAMAQNLAAILQIPYVVRENHSIPMLKEIYKTDLLLIITQRGPVVTTPGGNFFFHLSMAQLRIKNIINGKHDHMAAAMDLKPGMSVLDCTLGLATDAIVASFVAGTTGYVKGIENSPLISAVTRYGLQNFADADSDIIQSLRRVEVETADYLKYLNNLSTDSFDIVYFDPMFRRPIQSSSNVKPLRYLADDRPLLPEAVAEACRVAKRRVVIKEAHNSAEFRKFPLTALQGGKYSSIHYGIIEISG
ncbi:hypothetical protein P22_0248 [Propionispora sp. 2/2-37]|uniref:class I SAM-dependent methyltransferase n=1 Tax=Propionispora sp. 2/2-37 TaxID=1677858 RepID=UPI0006BB89F0|nr:class I SAM-dependent methyltransferase [Propionispora sp. 2/2-37]CUH94182.1 hypothetical protein P22_0248 [Propionispora sp. 2/2-37]